MSGFSTVVVRNYFLWRWVPVYGCNGWLLRGAPLQLLLYIGHDSSRIPWIEPLEGRIFPEPGKLAFRVLAGMCFHIVDSLIQGDIAIEEAEYFLVAYGAESVVVAVRQHRADFFHQAGLHHVIHAVMNIVMEEFFGQDDACFDHPEIAGRAGSAAKGGDGAAGGVQHFQCADEALGVLGFRGCVKTRIAFLQLLLQPGKPMQSILFIQPGTDPGRNNGHVIDTFRKGPDIKAGAAAHNGDIVLFKDFAGVTEGQFFVYACIYFLADAV